MPTVGTSTIYTTILPDQYKIDRLRRQKISREATFRLKVLDFYFHKGNRNVSLTSRHFMVSRAFVYKWLDRYNPRCLPSLESRSRRPKHTRSVAYSYELVRKVRKLRQEDPSFSSIKIAKILLRDFGIKISAATIGRIIRKFNLFLSRIIVMNKQRSVRLSRTWKIRREKYRKPYGLKAIAPHQIIEFDMKHIKLGNGTRQYAFCAIDPYTKEAVVHIASRPSSSQARVALDKVLERFGKDVTILNDNDSENMGKAYDYLKGQDITQLFARPYEPKDKPYVENFIGKYQKECLNESLGDPMSVAERQAEADKWVRKWHFYRPHQSLEYQTPAEFCATLGITIPHGNLSTM